MYTVYSICASCFMHASVLCLAAATDHRIILNSFSLQFPTFCTPKKSFLRQPASQPACTTIRTAVSSNTHTHTLTCLMNVCMHLAVMMAILVGFPSFRIFSFVPSFFPFFMKKTHLQLVSQPYAHILPLHTQHKF